MSVIFEWLLCDRYLTEQQRRSNIWSEQTKTEDLKNSNCCGSSLICNTSTRHERHECVASKKRVRHERQECDTSATWVLQERHECDMSAARTTWMKKFDCDSGTSKNIFLHHYIYYMTTERIQGEKQIQWSTFLKCLASMLKCV